MSVFRVKLNNVSQGTLDVHPTTKAQLSTSYQRTVYVMGPNRINRALIDGETFTDCNYWKKFAYPQAIHEDAFIEVVTVDGSVYSDVASENVYPLVYDLSVEAGTTYTDTDNVADIATDTGSYAAFAQITNQHDAQTVRMRINGTAVVDLPALTTQVFNSGDLAVSKLEFDNSESGAAGPAAIQILLSVRSSCNS
jgi:hypothetical protein